MRAFIKNELWVNPSTLFAYDSTAVEASFYQDDSRIKFQYQWDYDYDGVTFDIDGSGLPSPNIEFTKPGKKNLGLRVRTNSVPPQEYIYNIPAYSAGKVFDGVPSFANTTDYFTSPQGNNAVAATEDAFYVVFTGKQPGGWDVFLAKIDKLTGDNWVKNVTDSISADRCYDPSLAVIEEGPIAGVYIVFTCEDGGLTDIMSTHGNLDGSGFDLSNIVHVTSTNDMNEGKPCLLYNYDGGNLVGFYQGVKLTNESYIYSVVSFDFAHSWLYPTRVDPGFDNEYRPSAAYSSISHNCYVVWEDDRNGASLRDLYLAVNPGGNGILWDPPTRLATSPETSAIWDEKPCMSCRGDQLAIAYLQRPNGSDFNSIHVLIKPLSGAWEVHYQITELYGNYDYTEPSISIAANGIFMVGFGAIWENTVVKSVVVKLVGDDSGFYANVIKEESVGSPGDYSSLISPCVVCYGAGDGYALETFVMSTDYTDGYVEENSRHLGKLNGFYYVSESGMY